MVGKLTRLYGQEEHIVNCRHRTRCLQDKTLMPLWWRLWNIHTGSTKKVIFVRTCTENGLLNTTNHEITVSTSHVQHHASVMDWRYRNFLKLFLPGTLVILLTPSSKKGKTLCLCAVITNTSRTVLYTQEPASKFNKQTTYTSLRLCVIQLRDRLYYFWALEEGWNPFPYNTWHTLVGTTSKDATLQTIRNVATLSRETRTGLG